MAGKRAAARTMQSLLARCQGAARYVAKRHQSWLLAGDFDLDDLAQEGFRVANKAIGEEFGDLETLEADVEEAVVEFGVANAIRAMDRRLKDRARRSATASRWAAEAIPSTGGQVRMGHMPLIVIDRSIEEGLAAREELTRLMADEKTAAFVRVTYIADSTSKASLGRDLNMSGKAVARFQAKLAKGYKG